MAKFNIRVYGIYITEKREILLSDEQYQDLSFTKFPGGGLEFGEGTIDCLKREFREEFGLDITVGELFYLTDFFQPSFFSPDDQVISVYYRIGIPAGQLENALGKSNERESLRLVNLHDFDVESLTFPIDKFVAEMIHQHFPG